MKLWVWIKRIQSRLHEHNVRVKYEGIRKQQQALPDKKPNRKHCLEILLMLNSEKFRGYTPHYGRQVSLCVDIANLEAFTKKLLDTSALVVRESPVPPSWMKTDEVSVPFDRLFVSNDGFYLDVASAVARFQKAGVKLCELMEQSDSATHGIYEHNFRMLTRLFVQLREVSTCLVEVSLQR